MIGSRRASVDAGFRIGPRIPGVLLPAALGLVGLGASLLLLQNVLLVIGAGLALLAAVRVRSAAPWLLIGLVVLGRLVRSPAELGGSLPLVVLAVHLIATLALLAGGVPVRSWLQLAALLPQARTFVLVQLPAQVLAAAVLVLDGRLAVVPVASAIGGALLLATAALLVVPRLVTGPAERPPAEG